MLPYKTTKKIFSTNPILNKLTSEEREFFIEKSIEIIYKKKETIFKQSSHAHYIFILVNGLSKMFIEGGNGRTFIMSIQKSGDFIGCSQLYDSPYYDYSTVALKESLCIQIPIEDIKSLIKSNNKFTAELIKLNCFNTQLIFQKMFTIGTKQMHGRLSDIILELSKPGYIKEKIFSYLSRKDMADLTGMSTESIIRLIGEFKHDGLIKEKGKSIVINNMELLLRLSNIG